MLKIEKVTIEVGIDPQRKGELGGIQKLFELYKNYQWYLITKWMRMNTGNIKLFIDVQKYNTISRGRLIRVKL